MAYFDFSDPRSDLGQVVKIIESHNLEIREVMIVGEMFRRARNGEFPMLESIPEHLNICWGEIVKGPLSKQRATSNYDFKEVFEK